MNIVVLMKQVPGTSSVGVDPTRGTLRREGVPAQTNPYDLHALEAALALKEQVGGTVTVVSMGPPQAEAVIREAYWMGADHGILLTDRVFAGADTLATAFTLSQALKTLEFDLIIAGMQSTDGDTAQVGPGVAEFLDIPHVSYVREIKGVAGPEVGAGTYPLPEGAARLTVTADLGDTLLIQDVCLPALITVTKDLNQPRLPSFKLRKAVADKPVSVMRAEDLPASPKPYYGLAGSATRVEKIFPPERTVVREIWEGEPDELASRLAVLLREVVGK
ncbi:MAG TPA: electron transfer flavoprotein subunit beta/FixA family protein [Firmicutes bacterium]|nr:electron transfer flavoprotein subunit beta/FixA family protein [Candidatus Fermentithermobacillaceae bacterium]